MLRKKQILFSFASYRAALEIFFFPNFFFYKGAKKLRGVVEKLPGVKKKLPG